MMFWIILGIFIVFAVICFLVFNYFRYYENYKTFNEEAKKWHDKNVELTFDEVMKYSAIKPEKWIISGGSISYKTGKRTQHGGENNFYVYFKSYKEYTKFIQWWADKKMRAKQEEELRIGLEFCDLMKADCKALKEESQKAIRKATIESARLIKQTIETDKDISHKYECKVNEDGTIEIRRYGNNQWAQLTKQPEGSITCG